MSQMDRHAFIKQAMLHGMPEPQAEVIAVYVQEAGHHTQGQQEREFMQLATKMDSMATKTELKMEVALLRTDMSALELRLEKNISEVRADLGKYMMSGFLTVIGLLAAVLMKLH